MSKSSEKAMQCAESIASEIETNAEWLEEFGDEQIAIIAKHVDAYTAEALSEQATFYQKQLDTLTETVKEHKRVLGLAESALADAQSGLDYVRQHHGNLYGVGFDRCEQSSRLVLAAIAELKTNEKRGG